LHEVEVEEKRKRTEGMKVAGEEAERKTEEAGTSL